MYRHRYRGMGKRVFALMTAALSMLMLSSCGSGSNEADLSGDNGSGRIISKVVINTTVRKTGQYPEEIVVTLGKKPVGKKLSAGDFHMTGEAGGWQAKQTHSFEADFESVELKGDTLTLVPRDFPEKFFYVEAFSVFCTSDPELSFSNEDVTEIHTPLADDFLTYVRDGAGEKRADGIELLKSEYDLDYHLYTPDKTGKMPIVVVFHGFGDTSNLLTYRTAVEWVEPDNQKNRPCYVLAPTIDDPTYYSDPGRSKAIEQVKLIIDDMIAAGQVDPDRIYVMGNSFGGMASIEFAEKYPESTTAVLALCPALRYSRNAFKNLKKMKDVPVYFCHAEHDGTIEVSTSETAVKILKSVGAGDVNFKKYTDDEMNAAGASPDNNNTYSYHHVELAVMPDEAYMEWLMGK